MYVDIRATYVVQTYLPLVHNFYPDAEQHNLIEVTSQSYIAFFAILYSSTHVLVDLS